MSGGGRVFSPLPPVWAALMDGTRGRTLNNPTCPLLVAGGPGGEKDPRTLMLVARPPMSPLCRREEGRSLPGLPEPWIQGQGTSSGRLPSLSGVFTQDGKGFGPSFAECFFLLLASLWSKPSCFPFPASLNGAQESESWTSPQREPCRYLPAQPLAGPSAATSHRWGGREVGRLQRDLSSLWADHASSWLQAGYISADSKGGSLALRARQPLS